MGTAGMTLGRRINAKKIQWEMDIRGWSIVDAAAAAGMGEFNLRRGLKRGSLRLDALTRLQQAFIEHQPIPGLAEILADDGESADVSE